MPRRRWPSSMRAGVPHRLRAQQPVCQKRGGALDVTVEVGAKRRELVPGADAETVVVQRVGQRGRFGEGRASVRRAALLHRDVAESRERLTQQIVATQAPCRARYVTELVRRAGEVAERRQGSGVTQPDRQPFGVVRRIESKRPRVVAVRLPDTLTKLGLPGGPDERRDRPLDGWLDAGTPHLAGEEAGMLEVVGEDLDELLAAGGQLLHPVAEAHVERHPAPPRQTPVGDVADHGVTELPLALIGDRGRLPLDEEAPASERLEQAELHAVLVEIPCRAGPEDPACHRHALGEPALLRRKPVEPRTDERLQVGGDGERFELRRIHQAVVEQHAGGLLEEQRIATRIGHEAADRGPIETLVEQRRQQSLDERLARRDVERTELDNRAPLDDARELRV